MFQNHHMSSLIFVSLFTIELRLSARIRRSLRSSHDKQERDHGSCPLFGKSNQGGLQGLSTCHGLCFERGQSCEYDIYAYKLHKHKTRKLTFISLAFLVGFYHDDFVLIISVVVLRGIIRCVAGLSARIQHRIHKGFLLRRNSLNGYCKNRWWDQFGKSEK